MGKFKRNGVWYGQIKDNRGRWIKRTLNTSDARVADVRYRELERREADPTYRAANETSLAVAAAEFVTSRQVKGCAAGTLCMYDQKIAHLGRLFGSDLPLVQIDAPKVDRFIAARLGEGASRNTVGKELTALRGLLRVAKRAGKFPFDLDAVMPVEWSNEYEPRRVALTPEQVAALIQTLASPRTWTDSLGKTYQREPVSLNKAAFVAFVVATGARYSEAARAVRSQIDLRQGWVYFQITKTRKKGKREKYVPITPATRPLLEQVIAATAGRNGPLFDSWGNARRDLRAACDAAGVPRVSPNDLRRTHANWLVAAGVALGHVAEVLGHVDSRMVERVYGKLRPAQLRDRILAAMH